ncbi:MAG: peptidoglycan-binding protein LysM [Bacteroidota bacterium]
MGLFSFLKKAGSKLFSKNEAERESTTTNGIADEVAAEQKLNLLRGVVDSLCIQVYNLDLELNEDTVVVFGQTESQSDKEKVILALGNVAGIAAVDDRMIVEAPEAVAETPKPKEVESRFYEVQKGDYLSKIAKEMYGDAMKYPVIFEANKPMLTDPDKIYPGQVLRIPSLEGVA